MPDKCLYLVVDILCLLFPFVLSFHRRLQFYRQWRYFIVPCVITSVIFVLWDAGFTALGVWQFNSRYVLGIYFLGLPLEEFLFFLCIPYACVFTYYSLSVLFRLPPTTRGVQLFTLVLALSLFTTALWCIPMLYTSVTFSLLFVILIVLLYKRASFLSAFYISFVVTLIPFYISNGVLTGAVTPEPVVKYNDQYNIGIRTLTIPVEDIFYGMALLLMNISGFEYMRRKQL